VNNVTSRHIIHYWLFLVTSD